MRRVTSGVSRTVFLVGRFAIKVPCGRYTWAHWLRDLLANLQEREWSRVHIPALCPVLFADPLGLVVVMPRAQILDREFTDAEWTRMRGASVLPVERKPDSWGYLHGRLVAVDYGN